MMRLSPLFFSSAIVFANIAASQVPQLVNFQGRVLVGNMNFDGIGQFKFALVNSNGTATYWSNDGTSSGGSQPASAVSIAVSRGLYSVLLGNANLPNMGVLPTGVFTNADLRLRVWFNDGTNGFQLFTPDQRVAAVGYAIMAGNVPDGAISSNKLADGAVTLSKVGNDVRAGLGGTPSGGVMLTENPNATNLLALGFVKLYGVTVVTEEWESSLADTNIIFSSMSPPPIWTGNEAYLFRETAMSGPLGSRYHPGSNTWHTLPTNGMPAFTEYKPVWMGNDLMVLGGAPEGMVAARYRPGTDTWQAVPTNGAPYYSSWESKVLWTGTELLVLSGTPEGFKGGRYHLASNTWLPISTNGAPVFSSWASKALWTGTELIVLTMSPEFSGGRYRPATDVWLPVSTNGAPFAIGSDAKAVWSGNAVVVLSGSPAGPFGARYYPATNTWLSVTTNGAPTFPTMDAKILWTGTEVILWNPMGMSYEQRAGLYSPATDVWRSPNPDAPRFGIGSGPPAPDPLWTGTEMVAGFSFDQTMYSYAGGRYSPVRDSWTGISHPSDKPGGSASLMVWTGEQAIVFLNDMRTMQGRVYKWTPSRKLHVYQKL